MEQTKTDKSAVMDSAVTDMECSERIMLHLCVLVLLCCGKTIGAPMSMDMEAVGYLVQFGYMDPQMMRNDTHMPDDMMENMMTTALTDFQMFVGLEPTGEMNGATHDMMTKPRCGMKDKHDYDEGSRMKRYAKFGHPWTKHNLTFTVNKYPNGKKLTKSAVNEEMSEALVTWAAVTDLSVMFVQNNKHADINITFISGEHGDVQPFDGKGMILGHALTPPSGKVHFDNDEVWTIRKHRGQNLFYVAVHEFGHALGLDHSSEKKSVMYPYAKLYNPYFKLHSDDILGIQSMYGTKKQQPPNLCADSTIDAIFECSSGIIYVLKGAYYWRLAADGPVSGYPKFISHKWSRLPSNVDAAFALPSGKTYFFKGNQTWAYKNEALLPKYPRLISEEWQGIPDNVDAAMHYEKNTFFFFKGDHYWRYDGKRSPNVQTDKYPKLILKWDGILGDLEDVLRIGNSAFFFRKGRYYRFNCITGLVDRGCPDQPNYHRPTGPWWFRCRDKDAKSKKFSYCQGDYAEEYEDDVIDSTHLEVRSSNTGCLPVPILSTILVSLLILSKTGGA